MVFMIQPQIKVSIAKHLNLAEGWYHKDFVLSSCWRSNSVPGLASASFPAGRGRYFQGFVRWASWISPQHAVGGVNSY